ncbi:MAG: hypothetical protein ACR2PX_11525 [Endozoicomonas sp.]|uniref:hypothetical protein n=1 Tax=Endozoicomonas sp. TaxID=1892382 RepID=UPI003D9AE3C6
MTIPEYSDQKQAVDLAVRMAWSLDAIDLGINAFKGNSREPLLIDKGYELNSNTPM